jgi:hypothetical protein
MRDSCVSASADSGIEQFDQPIERAVPALLMLVAGS